MKILSVNLRFSPNAEKCRPQKLRIWTLLGSDHVMISVEKDALIQQPKVLADMNFFNCKFFLQVGLLPFSQVGFLSPLKLIENAFYFTAKSLFSFEIFKLLFYLFRSCRTTT